MREGLYGQPSRCAHGLLGRRLTSFVIMLMLFTLLPAVGCADPSPARQAQLLNMLKEDCGACHGMTLKGGLGPNITPQALKDKPRALILSTILDGRPGTPMPPWKPFMSREEAQWLVQRLYDGDY